MQELNQSPNCLNISLHNQGYGFGFTVKETEDKSTVVSAVFPDGVAHKVTNLEIVHYCGQISVSF